MTDHYNAVTVTVVFEKDVRSDDAEATINAIKLLRGVLAVKPHVVDVNYCTAETRVRAEVAGKLRDVLRSLCR